MKIGGLEIKGRACLAPMAGATDGVFRELCAEFGASYVVTEMASAKGLAANDKKSAAIIKLSEAEKPAVVQIFGSEPEIMARAAKIAEAEGAAAVDINMGCPVPKIVGSGSGCALMKNPGLAAKIVEACVNAVGIPVTAKIRSGWDDDSLNAVYMAETLENAGASAVTVHGRTKKQGYSSNVNFDIIRDVKRAVKIPVIGNGDVVGPASAANMYERTGCDLTAIGRGALGAPWIFSEINEYFEKGAVPSEPSPEERAAVMLRHVRAVCERKGEYIGIRQARKHAIWYFRGTRGAARMRSEISSIDSFERLEQIVENVVNASKK